MTDYQVTQNMGTPPQSTGASMVPTPQTQGVMQTTEASRAVTGVAMMGAVAKQYPRQYSVSRRRLEEMCSSKILAKNAEYSFPRGKTEVSGASIRLAEALMIAWGNLNAGVVEMERNSVKEESLMRAFCYDAESNIAHETTWTVKHVRDTKNGSYRLTDERDIYEAVMNQAARRKRACILAAIPKFFQDEAVEMCRETLKKSGTLNQRINAMVAAFDKIGVTEAMISNRIGHSAQTIKEPELVALGRIYNSISDHMSKVSDWFENGETTNQDGEQGGSATYKLASKLKSNTEPAAVDELNTALADMPTDLRKSTLDYAKKNLGFSDPAKATEEQARALLEMLKEEEKAATA